jgi:hypothetical protein
MTMPSISRDFDGTEHKLLKLGHRGWDRIKTSLTWPMQERPPCFLILDQEVRMKFNEGIIIKGKTMNRDKILVSRRNMKNIIEDKIADGVGIMVLPIRVISIPEPFAA